MGNPKMPNPHYCRGMQLANAEITQLRDQVADRNDMIAAVEQENDTLREQVAKLQAENDALQACMGSYPMEIAQLQNQLAKLEATIDSVRKRIRWTPPKYGMHTNGPCYVFHDGYQRIIEEILNGQPFEESNDTHA